MIYRNTIGIDIPVDILVPYIQPFLLGFQANGIPNFRRIRLVNELYHRTVQIFHSTAHLIRPEELLRRGERFWFTPEEEALITENNRDFQQQPAEEQLFLRYFKIAEDIEEAKPLLASEILDMIAEKQPGFNITKTMILNFGKLLKRNSVPNKRTMRGTCYYVEEVDG